MQGHGTQVDAQYVPKNTRVQKPANPTAEGWTFKYWYESNESVAFDFTQPIPATGSQPARTRVV